MSVLLFLAVRQFLIGYDLLEMIPDWTYYVFATLVVLFLTRKIKRYVSLRAQRKERIYLINKKADEYKLKLEQSLLVDGILVTKDRDEIVRLSVADLLKNLGDGSLSCVQVMRAYQAKALEVTKATNCINQFLKEAEDWAAELDRSSTKGPLHGLPVSIKENVSITGYDSTTGLSIHINKPAERDAALVVALKKLGAVPFCLTNVPQTMISFGCSNPIWGLTTHPLNKERTPGGSSGGESCLVAGGGSPFGIGSDIGGSARCPPAFCGIPSIKPTSQRLSYKGFRKSARGCIGIPSVPGLIARDVETLELVSRLLLENNFGAEHDSDVFPIPWNHQLHAAMNRKLRIGYYDCDGFFPTTPGMKRAVRMAREGLQKLGHELVPFSPSRVDYMLETYVSVMQCDQGRYLLDALSIEDIDPVLKPMYLAMNIPYFVKKMLSPIIRLVAPRSLPAFLGAAGYRFRHSYQLWDALQQMKDYKDDLMSSWRANGLDLVIAPSWACPAPRWKDVGRLTPAGTYTILYNFVDFPAGVVPITEENEEDQALLEEYNHKDLFCYLLKQTTKGATGMPLSIQVVGLPFQEEAVLHGMQILQSAIKL